MGGNFPGGNFPGANFPRTGITYPNRSSEIVFCALFLCGHYSLHCGLWKPALSTYPFQNRSNRPQVFCKKVFLKVSQNSQEHTCDGVSFSVKLQDSDLKLSLKKTPTQVFCCEFSDVFRNMFFIERLRWLLFQKASFSFLFDFCVCCLFCILNSVSYFIHFLTFALSLYVIYRCSVPLHVLCNFVLTL